MFEETNVVHVAGGGGGGLNQLPGIAFGQADEAKHTSMSVTFPDIDLVTAEKVKQVITDAIPLGTSYSVSFSPLETDTK